MPHTATFPPSLAQRVRLKTSAAGHECLLNPESVLNLPPQRSDRIFIKFKASVTWSLVKEQHVIYYLYLVNKYEHAISIYLANSNFATIIVVNVINMGLTLVR